MILQDLYQQQQCISARTSPINCSGSWNDAVMALANTPPACPTTIYSDMPQANIPRRPPEPTYPGSPLSQHTQAGPRPAHQAGSRPAHPGGPQPTHTAGPMPTSGRPFTSLCKLLPTYSSMPSQKPGRPISHGPLYSCICTSELSPKHTALVSHENLA